MDAIATLLTEQQNAKVQEIWTNLRSACGLRAIEVTPIPHFSWGVAEGYDLATVDEILASIAESATPFTVKTGGAGLFLNPNLTLFLPVVKNRALLDLHDSIWRSTSRHGSGVNSHYAPDSWIPHITLAQHDLTDQNLGCAIKELTRQVLDWQLLVNNLAIICQQAGEVGSLRSSYPFIG